MNRIFLIFALLFLIGCSEGSDPVPEQNNEENTEPNDNKEFLINGLSCSVYFDEEGYSVKVSKDNKFLFEASEEIGKGSRQYIDLGEGRLRKIDVSNILIINALQYENTYYLLLDLKENDVVEYWGIRKLYVMKDGQLNKKTLDSRSFLPTVMNLWFENSVHLFVPPYVYLEAVRTSCVLNDELEFISKNCPIGSKALDMTHAIECKEHILSFYDIQADNKLWSYKIELENKNFSIDSWDASYSSNNTVLVNVNITYITGEKEVLNFEFDKDTGEIITPNQITQ